MKSLLILFITLFVVTGTFAQKKSKQKLNLTNALVIAQLDNPEDRYSLEINFTELLSSRELNAQPSLNFMKFGADSQILASDSILALMKSKGIDTYALVSVRGYDKRFKKSERKDDLKTALTQGSLFDLYRLDIVSISFEFKFYRDGQVVYTDIVKCGNVGDRATVLKRFRKKVGRRIDKKWASKR